MKEKYYLLTGKLVNISRSTSITMFPLLLLCHLLEHECPCKRYRPFKLAAFQRPSTITDIIRLLIKYVHLCEAFYDVLLDQSNLVVVVTVEHSIARFHRTQLPITLPQLWEFSLVYHGDIRPHLYQLQTCRNR